MNQYKHCDLCMNVKKSLKVGMTCGLNNKKPDFKNFCPDLEFSNAFKDYVSELLDEIEGLNKKKISVYINFILFSIIGLVIIIVSYSRLEKTFKIEFNHSSWSYFMGTFLIYLIGTFLITSGYQNLYKYKKSLKKLKSDKKEIDIVLKKYKIDLESMVI